MLILRNDILHDKLISVDKNVRVGGKFLYVSGK